MRKLAIISLAHVLKGSYFHTCFKCLSEAVKSDNNLTNNSVLGEFVLSMIKLTDLSIIVVLHPSFDNFFIAISIKRNNFSFQFQTKSHLKDIIDK